MTFTVHLYSFILTTYVSYQMILISLLDAGMHKTSKTLVYKQNLNVN